MERRAFLNLGGAALGTMLLPPFGRAIAAEELVREGLDEGEPEAARPGLPQSAPGVGDLEDGFAHGDGTPNTELPTTVMRMELLERPGFLLLARGNADELRGVLGELGTVAAIGTDVLDADDVVGQHYGLGSDGLALVRPDGYLGLVADSTDASVVRRYLADVLRVGAPASV